MGAQYSTFNPKLVSEHGEAALGRLARGLVLNHIPMLHENPISHSNYIRRNPVHRQADTRKAPVQDDKVPFGHNRSCFISKRRRNALDETEQTIATRMVVSTLHHYFRMLRSMSPLQCQKQLRLQSARNVILNSGLDAAGAAFEVGYENPTQFNHKYSRFFGQPPIRDVRDLRESGARPSEQMA
jgi:AraC-like DNA-binding protein